MAIGVSKEQFLNMPLSYEQIYNLFYLTKELFKSYLDDYYSSIPLSDDWIKRKKQSLFWRGLNYNEGKGAFQNFSINPKPSPDGNYYAGWFEFDVPDYFKIAADKIPERRLLPNNEKSFNEGGEPTADFCSFINELSYEAAKIEGLIS